MTTALRYVLKFEIKNGQLSDLHYDVTGALVRQDILAAIEHELFESHERLRELLATLDLNKQRYTED